jgi:sugar O-acyltransferase (sialic acid O-acetyltransferase NeuD family)
MEKVVIFGTTETAIMSHFYLTDDSPYEVVAFTANRDYISEGTLRGLPIVPFEDIEMTHPPDDHRMLVAISYGRWNRLRAEKYQEAKEKGYDLVSYVSSKAFIGPESVVGENCIIFQNSICEPFSRIGSNVIIRVGCSVGHHSVIGDHCFLAPHAVVLGHVTVEPYCFLGANCTIRNRTVIARESIIGAGTLILEDTQEKGVYKGNRPTLLPVSSDSLESR